MALIGPWDLSLAPEWLWGAQPYSDVQLHRGEIFPFLFSPQGLSEVLTSPDCT